MKYTFEEKLRIVTLLKSGYPLKRLCKERRLDHHVVGIWRARYELHGEDGLRFGTRAYGYAAEKKEEIVRAHLE
ncbi:MAG: transposase, partial [Muribaculaceae bacterium]|nr:transposase [Muribaculaceae bacterium]